MANGLLRVDGEISGALSARLSRNGTGRASAAGSHWETPIRPNWATSGERHVPHPPLECQGRGRQPFARCAVAVLAGGEATLAWAARCKLSANQRAATAGVSHAGSQWNWFAWRAGVHFRGGNGCVGSWRSVDAGSSSFTNQLVQQLDLGTIPCLQARVFLSRRERTAQKITSQIISGGNFYSPTTVLRIRFPKRTENYFQTFLFILHEQKPHLLQTKALIYVVNVKKDKVLGKKNSARPGTKPGAAPLTKS